MVDMKCVWKYDLEFKDGIIEIEMPYMSDILDINFQGEPNKDNIKIWALVEPDIKRMEKRKFIIFGTGHSINTNNLKHMEHIKTIQMLDGKLVFHIFEVRDYIFISTET